MEKPEIKSTVYRGDEIVEFKAEKLVKPSGASGHVILPRKLIDKYVRITYKKEKLEKKKNEKM